MPLATNDRSPVAYFVREQIQTDVDVTTSSHIDFLGPKKSTRDPITEQTVDVYYHVTVSFKCYMYKHCDMLNVDPHVFIGDVCLADMLLDAVPTSQLFDWAETNRGCFVLCR